MSSVYGDTGGGPMLREDIRGGVWRKIRAGLPDQMHRDAKNAKDRPLQEQNRINSEKPKRTDPPAADRPSYGGQALLRRAGVDTFASLSARVCLTTPSSSVLVFATFQKYHLQTRKRTDPPAAGRPSCGGRALLRRAGVDAFASLSARVCLTTPSSSVLVFATFQKYHLQTRKRTDPPAAGRRGHIRFAQCRRLSYPSRNAFRIYALTTRCDNGEILRRDRNGRALG